jgi:hypothetical protein
MGVRGHRAPQGDAVSMRYEDLLATAEIRWPEHGRWLYETWRAHNEKYFGGRLEPIGLILAPTPYGGSYGLYRLDDKTITIHPSTLDPRSTDPWGMGAKLGKSYASDVILHEQVHQLLHQDGLVSRHNSDPWCTEIVRISAIMGIEIKAARVRQRRVVKGGNPRWAPLPGHMTRRQLSSWPHSIRPAGYYGSGASKKSGQPCGEPPQIQNAGTST